MAPSISTGRFMATETSGSLYVKSSSTLYCFHSKLVLKVVVTCWTTLEASPIHFVYLVLRKYLDLWILLHLEVFLSCTLVMDGIGLCTFPATRLIPCQWIMGLGSIKSAWQRQTLKYGHIEGDKYSSLIFDNRGMGESDVPIMRYSTSEMAKDVIELLDHLGWTKERQLYVSGVSMGGMIAQELV